MLHVSVNSSRVSRRTPHINQGFLTIVSIRYVFIILSGSEAELNGKKIPFDDYYSDIKKNGVKTVWHPPKETELVTIRRRGL